MSSGDEKPAPNFGRGMISAGIDEDDMVVLEHLETGEQFEFARADLDEVIGMLSTFRMELEAAEEEHEESNGET